MIYILIFVVLCILDWKLDTYAFFKFIGGLILVALFPMIVSSFSPERVETQEISTFSQYNITTKSRGERGSYFTSVLDTGEMITINKHEIIFEKGKENKVSLKREHFSKEKEILFFAAPRETYIIELKE